MAAEFPDKLLELRAIFDREARAYDVYPLSDQTTLRALPHNRPSLLEGKTRFTLYRDHVRQSELATVSLKNTSFDLRAKLKIPEGGAEGVVICQGGNMAGWSLYAEGRHAGLPLQPVRAGADHDRRLRADAGRRRGAGRHVRVRRRWPGQGRRGAACW